jgi:hypothetical protein
MAAFPPVLDLLARLALSEKALLRKHGIRLRVEKVTLDGHNALCSAMQVQRRFLRADHTQEAIVEFCQLALAPIYMVGMSPLIRAYPRNKGELFQPIDTNDPFGLRAAMHTKDLATVEAPESRISPGVVKGVAYG